MSIYVGEDKATLFHGDHHPASFYKGDKLIAGFETPTLTGKDQISFQAPYKANMDSVKAYGWGKQDGTPNPDYPIEPKFYPGGELSVGGKNLIPDSLLTIDGWMNTGYLTYEYILSVDPGVYTIHADMTNPKNGFLYVHRRLKGSGDKWQDIPEKGNGLISPGYIRPRQDNVMYTDLTFTVLPEYEYELWAYSNFSITDLQSFTMCRGIAPTYEPYYPPQIAQIPILRALPDGSVRDEYDVRTGVLTRRIFEEIYDGSESWSWIEKGIVYITPKNRKRYSWVISNQYITRSENLQVDNQITIMAGEGFAYFITDKTHANTLEEWVAYLSEISKQGNPLRIWYVLETPIIEQLPPQLLHQHPGHTYLTQEPNQIPIEKTVASEVIAVHDVNETVHEVECRVKSTNVCPQTQNPPETINGVAFTPNPDGSISVKGTATNICVYTIGSNPNQLEDGKTYYMNESAGVFLSCRYKENGAVQYKAREFTWSDRFTDQYFYLLVTEGVTVDATIFPMASADRLLPYTPPISDLTQVNVYRYGGNLLEYRVKPKAQDGLSFEYQSDGGIKITGTTDKKAYIYLISPSDRLMLPGAKYKLKSNLANVIIEASSRVHNYYFKSTDVSSESVFTDYFWVRMAINPGETFNGDVLYPTICLFKLSEQSYKPFIPPQILTPSPDGTVTGMTSLSPDMTILTDTPGAVITAKYESNQNEETIYADMSAKVYKER